MTPPLKSPTTEDIEALAECALADIPQELNEVTGDIVFRVEDFPDNKTVAALELDAPFELLGHYQGVDLTQKKHRRLVSGAGYDLLLPAAVPG